MEMRAVFSSAPVAIWKRRLNKFSRLSARRRSSSSSESSLSSLALKEISLSLHEFCLDGELHPGEAHGLAGERLGNSGELEHDAAGLDHSDPVLGRALAGAHAGFGVTGLSGKTLIQTFPPRLMWRVMAIRAASIWRLVTQPVSSDFRP